MQQILSQVGALLFGAIPTALLFLVLVVAYQWLVQGPLTRILKERRARTEGAVEEASKAIAQAEERATDYAAKLREARAEVLKQREARLKQWSSERDTALDAARHAAAQRVHQAIAELEAEAAAARAQIQSSAAELGQQVVRAVLPLAAGGAR